ncbi:MAG: hypothetical protein KC877_00695 [Candidatus Kaiserbacteria bacterium]|nr:hypothetical protein [Candidatus Kaiserbacteria bacterium]MCB9815949.1 hypothetical protein [Candidatus Nomurabacteria bacterium]
MFFSNVTSPLLQLLPGIIRDHAPIGPSTAFAATGDFATFRESTAGDTISQGGPPVAIKWDTTISSNANLGLQANTSDIDLADGGKYFVTYSAWAYEGTAGGTNRRTVDTYLTLNNVPLAYGRGSGYIRDNEGDTSAYANGGAIISAAAGDDLEAYIKRNDGNATAGTQLQPGVNGISVLKLPESADYLRARIAATSSSISANTSFTDVVWDTADEVDTGSFAFTPSSGNITMKGAAGTNFMITANVGLYVSGGGTTRQNYEMRLTLDGVEVPGSRVTTYLRGSDNTWYGTLAYMGIISKTSASDQTLNIEIRRESTGGATTVIQGDKAGLAIMALPDIAEVVRLTDNSGTQQPALTSKPLYFDTNDEVDASAFGHSTSANQDRVTISAAGDYLFFATAYSTTSNSDNNREPFRIDWNKTGSQQNYGGFGAFNRSNSTFSGGASGAILLNGLGTSDYVHLKYIDETTSAPENGTFNAGRVALQGIALNDNFFGLDVEVSASGTQTSAVDIPTSNTYVGGQFVVTENSGSRNVTNVTITESGTVDGANGLDNIKLYYDLDTSSPYDCASESYGGGESQFGSTDTNGFSGADGSSSFSDSVAITTTKALCLYPVMDIVAAATDGDTIELSIDNPTTDVVVTGGASIGPATTQAISGATTLRSADLTQTHYHWRNDDGDETDTVANATPTVKNTTSSGFGASTAGNDPVLTVPANAVEGDYMVVIFTTDDNNPTQTPTPPSSETWTLQESGLMPVDGTAAVSPPAAWIYTKFVSADDEANAGTKTYTWQDSAGSEEQAAQLILLNNVKGWGEFNTNLLTGNQTSINAPSVTTTETNEIVFHAAFKDNNATFTALPTGSTVVNSGWGPASDAGAALGIVYAVYPTVGATGAKTFSLASNEANGFTFSLQPTNAGGATSIEGAEDTPAIGFANGTVRRLRFEVSAEGSTSSLPTVFQLEYATKTAACNVLSEWVDVGVSDGGDWDVVDSTHVTNGANTTNITSAAYGALTDENSSFLSSNGGVRDTSSQTGSLILSSTQFVELEFAIEPTSGAPQGNTYCFRLSDDGTPLPRYDVYAEGTISADVDVSASGTQATSVSFNSANNYLGGVFVIERPGTNRTVTDITITESGTVDGQEGLDNIELWYDLDTTAPYDCTGESYGGGETQFGSTDTNGFSGSDGTSQFTSAGVNINETTSMCVYVVYDTTASSSNGETIDIKIASPSSDVVVTGSSVGPSTAVSPTGSTTIAGPILTQMHYHWRNDDGTESGATSVSGGVEDTPISAVPKESIRRLRLEVSNEGTVNALATNFRLEYGTKITTCDAVVTWTDVGEVAGAWDMALSSNIADGDTSDIALGANGALTNENTTFDGVGALRESTSESGAITLTTTEFTELEYSIEATVDSGYDTTYCFRVTDSGTELQGYDVYAELTTREKQDFYIQRGVTFVSGTSTTLVAGTDYIAPSAADAAFIRITNTQLTGAGRSAGNATQNADDVTAYIENPDNILNNIVIARPTGASDDTRVAWEIIEYIGIAGGDNEMIVRDHGVVSLGTTDLTATGATVSGVSNDSDIVVFVTGQLNTDTGTNYSTGLYTSEWSSSTDEPVFTRGVSGDTGEVSYAVVEFTGDNWKVQRIEHNYAAGGVTEVESVSAVNSLSRAFVHAQKRTSEHGLDETGHEVWLSSIGYLSFALESGVTSPTNHYSVAWVIENTQSSNGAMSVQRSNGVLARNTPCGGVEPCTEVVSITAVNESNASPWVTNRSSGSGTLFPRPIVGVRLVNSGTEIEYWRSDTGQPQTYRTEIVTWPVAETAVRQNYYRFYVDNDSLTPTDAWPVGAEDLGENTTLTAADDPLGEGERVRIRMSLRISNATLPELTKTFKLQYGLQETTCSAISAWTDVGTPGSGTIWRGYNGTEVDGTAIATSTPAAGTLLLTPSDVAGTYEEQNDSAVNPYKVDIGEDVEYDWVVQHNGAAQRSDYCFRVVNSDDSEIAGYINYPVIRTTGYTPIVANWRWYDDEINVTPSSPLDQENIAPTDIANQNTIKLRVTAAEVENAIGTNVKFALQYSEYADFSDGGTFLTSTSSCVENSIWCYADGAGVDGDLVTNATLSDADSCVGGVGSGCGTHNEAATTTSTFTHGASANAEFEFTLKNAGARVNAVYYFRLYDVSFDQPLVASSSYPSLVVEGPTLVSTLSGVDAGTAIAGIVTDATTTATAIGFGSVSIGTSQEAAQHLTINTNATEGYQLFLFVDQQLENAYGDEIKPITGTNAAPVSWATGCVATAVSCFGYHTTDAVLENASARFAPIDSYAALSTGAAEIMYSSIPSDDTHSIVYRMFVSQYQPAGDYEAAISYLVTPVF